MNVAYGEEIPEILHTASKLHEYLQQYLAQPHIGYDSIIIRSSDSTSTTIEIQVQKPINSLNPLVTHEMLKLGYIISGFQNVFDREKNWRGTLLVFSKIDCDVKLECTERGHVVVGHKTFRTL